MKPILTLAIALLLAGFASPTPQQIEDGKGWVRLYRQYRDVQLERDLNK